LKADLHMHTTHSDGRLSCKALFDRAKDKGLSTIAITDHDVTAEVENNMALAKARGMHYIPGIELSTLYQGKSVHVLGYFRNDAYNHPEMKDYYRMIKEGRENRAKTFIQKLKTHFDIHITFEQIMRLSGGIIARPHIASAIIENYPQYTHDYIFEQFIGDDAKAYVPSTELSTQEGIALLKRHNALVVLAHPVLLKPHIHDAVLALDFDGIEAIYCKNSDRDTAYYKEFAKDNGLFITAGSDYHGIENDSSHCDVGTNTLENNDLEVFLSKLNMT